MLDFLMKFYVKNELFDRALEIIQDETYLDEADFDEIKRQKRQSPSEEYQSEDEINSETIEAFFGALNLHEIVELPKMQIYREKRQMTTIDATNFNSLDEIIDALRSIPEFEEVRQQYCNLASAEFFGGTFRSTLESNVSCSESCSCSFSGSCSCSESCSGSGSLSCSESCSCSCSASGSGSYSCSGGNIFPITFPSAFSFQG